MSIFLNDENILQSVCLPFARLCPFIRTASLQLLFNFFNACWFSLWVFILISLLSRILLNICFQSEAHFISLLIFSFELCFSLLRHRTRFLLCFSLGKVFCFSCCLLSYLLSFDFPSHFISLISFSFKLCFSLRFLYCFYLVKVFCYMGIYQHIIWLVYIV